MVGKNGGEKKGFFERYPLLTEDWDDHVGPLIIDCLKYGFARIAREVVSAGIEDKNAPVRFNTNTALILGAKMLDGLIYTTDRKIENCWRAISPFGAGVDDFVKDSSNIEKVYVIQDPKTGIDCPVFLETKKGPPSNLDDEIRANIKQVLLKRESIYNGGMLAEEEYFNNKFIEPGAEMITWGDYPDLWVEPTRLKKYLVRNSVFDDHQNGEGKVYKKLDVDGTNFEIRVYKKTGAISNVINWASTMAAYGILQPFFTPLKFAARISGDKEYWQQYLKRQFEEASAVARNVRRSPGRNMMDFSLCKYDKAA